MVLVDASHEDEEERIESMLSAAMKEQERKDEKTSGFMWASSV
jgi:hypothetical protein